MDPIQTSNAELRTLREAARELTSILRQLEEGHVEKIVLTSKGKMVGVVLSVETYAELTA